MLLNFVDFQYVNVKNTPFWENLAQQLQQYNVLSANSSNVGQ